jgi:hypothetical protein
MGRILLRLSLVVAGGVSALFVAALLVTVFPYVLEFLNGELSQILTPHVPAALPDALSTLVMLASGGLLAFAVGALVRWQWSLLIGLLQVFLLRDWLRPLQEDPLGTKPPLWITALIILLPVAWGAGGWLGSAARARSDRAPRPERVAANGENYADAQVQEFWRRVWKVLAP